MSFYINNRSNNKPGTISSSALNTVCEKVLIEVKKVFDACISQDTLTGVVLTLTDFNPPHPAQPLTFISAESDPALPAVVSNVIIDRITARPNFANVSAKITIPVIVHFIDSNNVAGTARTSLTVEKACVLFVPQAAMSPVQITAQAALTTTTGTFTSATTVTATCCEKIILKVIAEVDIFVPSFGYPNIPNCQNVGEEQVQCPGFFDSQIYPEAIKPREQ